jgi:hypothetical protein
LTTTDSALVLNSGLLPQELDFLALPAAVNSATKANPPTKWMLDGEKMSRLR